MNIILVITLIIVFLIFVSTLSYLTVVLGKSLKFPDDVYLRPTKKRLIFFIILHIISGILTFLIYYQLFVDKHNAFGILEQYPSLYIPALILVIFRKGYTKRSPKNNIKSDVELQNTQDNSNNLTK